MHLSIDSQPISSSIHHSNKIAAHLINLRVFTYHQGLSFRITEYSFEAKKRNFTKYIFILQLEYARQISLTKRNSFEQIAFNKFIFYWYFYLVHLNSFGEIACQHILLMLVPLFSKSSIFLRNLRINKAKIVVGK